MSLLHTERIYMISMGSIVTGGALLQSHLLSTTTMNRLLLGICCMTKDLQHKHSLIFKKSLMLVKCNQMILLDYYLMINRQFTLQHLMQPSHSVFPVVSLMVRSDTNAGYSVSHGTIMVLPRDL